MLQRMPECPLKFYCIIQSFSLSLTVSECRKMGCVSCHYSRENHKAKCFEDLNVYFLTGTGTYPWSLAGSRGDWCSYLFTVYATWGSELVYSWLCGWYCCTAGSRGSGIIKTQVFGRHFYTNIEPKYKAV